MKIKDFLQEMETLCPLDTALEWDNVGLLVGSMGAKVERVYVALDVTGEVIKNAARHKCDLILTHHPLVFSPIKRVTTQNPPGSMILQIIAAGMNHIALHTNYDVCVLGDLVAKKLDMEGAKVLDVTDTQGSRHRGIGTIFTRKQPIEIKNLAKIIKKEFSLPAIYWYGNGSVKVKTIAIVPGSGKHEIDIAIEKGADVLVTGDMTHHEGLDALERGLPIIDAGHFGLEHIFVEHIKDYIEENLEDIKVIADPVEFPVNYL